MQYTYRLKELIIDKYGAEKYDTGCTMVAQWLNFWMTEIDPVNKYTHQSVHVLAEQTDSDVIHALILPEALALIQLFSLPDITYLFTSTTSEECLFMLKDQQSFINHK